MGPAPTPPLRLALVTPTRNHARWLERTVESVLSQEGPFTLDWLVLDGLSSDGTVELLRRHEGRLRWRSEADEGPASALARGLGEASGDVVGWLNSDDLLLPGALARVAAAFADPGVQWVHGRCLIVDEAGRPARRWVAAYKDWRCRRHSTRALLLENYVSQPTVFWRRGLYHRVGGIDPRLRYTFDYDLWLRFQRVAPPAFIDAPQAAFRVHPQSLSATGFEAQFREDLAVFDRHAPRSPWLRARKRLRSGLIVTAYRAMALAGGATR